MTVKLSVSHATEKVLSWKQNQPNKFGLLFPGLLLDE